MNSIIETILPTASEIEVDGAHEMCETQGIHEGKLSLQVVTELQQLLRLEGEWNAFLSEVEGDSPFVSHEWLVCWWQQFGLNRSLYIVIARRSDKICGIAPLMKSRESWYGMPLRRLGSPYNEHVQRMDFLVAPQQQGDFCEAIWSHFKQIEKEWDVIELSQFPKSSPTLREFERKVASAGFAFYYWQQGDSPYLPITGSWEEYIGGLSANTRSDIRRKLRRLRDSGEVELESLAAGDDIARPLEEGFRIEAMAWKGSKGTAILCDEGVRRFYATLAARMHKKNRLRLYFLTVGGTRIAFQYCLEYGNRIYLLKPGYNPEFSRYSPSQLLTWLVLRQAFESGKSEYDFLGDSDEWKLKWSRGCREHVWLFVLRDTLAGRLLRLLKFGLAPGARSMVEMLRRGNRVE